MQCFGSDLTDDEIRFENCKTMDFFVSFAEKTLCNSTVLKSIFLRFGLWRFARTFWRPARDISGFLCDLKNCSLC